MRLLTLTQLKEGRENLASLVEEFYLFFNFEKGNNSCPCLALFCSAP